MTDVFVRMTIPDFDTLRDQLYADGYSAGAKDRATSHNTFLSCGMCDGAYTVYVQHDNLSQTLAEQLAHLVHDHWDELVHARELAVAETPTPDTPETPPDPASDPIPTETELADTP